MKIERTISRSELIDTMHQVTMASNPDVRPYEHASISIEEMSVDDFSPTTLYQGTHRQDHPPVPRPSQRKSYQSP